MFYKQQKRRGKRSSPGPAPACLAQHSQPVATAWLRSWWERGSVRAGARAAGCGYHCSVWSCEPRCWLRHARDGAKLSSGTAPSSQSIRDIDRRISTRPSEAALLRVGETEQALGAGPRQAVRPGSGLSPVGFPQTCFVTNWCCRQLVALICLFCCRSLLEKNNQPAMTPAPKDAVAAGGVWPWGCHAAPTQARERASVAPGRVDHHKERSPWASALWSSPLFQGKCEIFCDG